MTASAGSLPVTAAIVGCGNIGTDLMIKLMRSEHLSLRWMIDVDPASEGLARAQHIGLETSAGGVTCLLAQPELPDIVFDATSAAAHAVHAPRAEAGIRAVDLTPAAVGPFVCPPVNLGAHADAANISMITCGGQATIPIVSAVSQVTSVPYAEIVASIASRSAGPGTRANMDEFTRTTARAIQDVGGAAHSKAIIVLDPATPPTNMRGTVFCAMAPATDRDAVTVSIHAMVDRVRQYVPGYGLRAEPQFDEPRPEWAHHGRVAVFLEVRGNGDHLPEWAGSLDIMTAAAIRAGEVMSQSEEAT